MLLNVWESMAHWKVANPHLTISISQPMSLDQRTEFQNAMTKLIDANRDESMQVVEGTILTLPWRQ